MNMSELISKALEETDGVWDDAVEKLRLKLRGNKRLFDEAVWPLILISLRVQVRSHDLHRHFEIWQGVLGDGKLPSGEADMSELKRAALSDAAVRAVGSLYNYPLPNGKRLGDAVYEDIQEIRDWHRTIEHGNRLRADWYDMILAKLPTKQVKVRKALSEAEIAGLMRRAAAQNGANAKELAA